MLQAAKKQETACVSMSAKLVPVVTPFGEQIYSNSYKL